MELMSEYEYEKIKSNYKFLSLILFIVSFGLFDYRNNFNDFIGDVFIIK